MTASRDLKRAAARAVASRKALEDNIRAHYAQGNLSLRDIAKLSGLSHETVRRIVAR